MKMKINKTVIGGLFLIFIMIGSSIAYGILQTFTGTQTAQEDEIELPSQNIIDYRLNSEQYRYLLRIGKTIVELEYSLACDECREIKSWLEGAANEFSNQLMLIELVVGDSDALPIVRIESSYGRIVLSEPTPDEVMSSFCDLLVDPPRRCAISGI